MLNVIATLIAIALGALALGWTPSWDTVKSAWSWTVAGAINLWSGSTVGVASGLQVTGRRVAAVLAAVALLFALLASPAGYRADGSWRSLYDAVVAFQIERGLVGDGLWGPKTHDAYRKGA